MALKDVILEQFISTIPNYVWIGLLLIAVGVILLLIPILPKKYGAIPFITGVLTIGGISVFNSLWQSSEIFRIGFIVALSGIAVVSLIFGGDEKNGKTKRR